MNYRFLTDPDISQLTACFNEAFSDYFVQFNATEEYLSSRWEIGRVNFDLSIGAFEGDDLIGFILTGVDEWKGLKTAYNAGTGLIPRLRGKGIMGEMYAKLIPLFRANEIRQSLLEVISQNTRAVRAYEKEGFQIVRRLRCFKGSIAQDKMMPFPLVLEVHKTMVADWEAYGKLNEFAWSWEHTWQAVEQMGAEVEIWEARDNKRLLAYYIYHPTFQKLVQWGSLKAHVPTLLRLIRQTLTSTEAISITNIDTSAARALSLMKGLGMKKTVDQFEMILALKSEQEKL